MKRVLLFIFLMTISNAAAATYYVTNTGSGSHNGNSYTNSLSINEHNSRSFTPGDTIYICDAITLSTKLIPPSSGTAGNYITYTGDCPGHPGSLQQHMQWPETSALMVIKNKQYIRIHNLVFDSDVRIDSGDSWAGLWIEEDGGATGHIEVRGCTFKETTSGIYICGNTRYVDIFSSTFTDMTNNGIGVFKCYGRSSVKPSFITIGGSRENGNTFVNIGRDDNPTSGSVPGQTVGTQADDLIFSYNHVYADAPGWGTGLYMNGVDRVLVEYNYVHDLDAVHRRPAINFKTDYDWKNNDIVIRFNKVGPTHIGNPRTSYVNPDYGIRIGHCMENVVIYGNYVTDVEAAGINANWGWDESEYANDECIMENIFIYSNIVDTSIYNSGISIDGTGTGTDRIKNLYIFNNVLYNTVTNYDSGASQRYGIQAISKDSKYQGMTIKNNIIDTSRDNDAKHVGIRVRVQNDLSIDYNHHYYPGSVPSVYYDDSGCVPCSWNSASRPAGYGTHDTGGDPQFNNNGNFALKENSPCKDSGEKLTTQIPSLTIHGNRYDFSLSDALHPSTDWTRTIPDVVVADQNDYGAWERGAYVYTGASIPICSQGQITQTCLCGGTEYSPNSGYCCSNIWQDSQCPLPPTPISQAGWSLLYVDSEELIYEDDAATNAFDNNANTFWHSEWYQNADSHPSEIQIDLGRSYEITEFYYLPRQDLENGRINEYELYVSMDSKNWGNPATGNFANSASEQSVNIQKTGRYIRLVALSEVNGEPWTSVAELNIVGTDSCTTITDLSNAMEQWKTDMITITYLLSVIQDWKNGC